MNLKKFNEYFIKENILSEDEDENENKWEVRIDDATNSFWEYKHDAIENGILEILDTNGDENGLNGYEDEDGDEMSIGEIADMLDDLDESEFYDKLDELKEFVGYDRDIKLFNIADEDELEFLEED